MTNFAKTIAAAALALALPTAASAACGQAGITTHDIEIQRGGFFPRVIYICSGNKIRFTNRTGLWADVDASDNSWSTPWIASGTSTEMTFTTGMKLSTYTPEFWNSGRGNQTLTIVFGTAPKG